MKYSLTDDMDSCISNINTVHESLDNALKLSKEVKNSLLASTWSGQNKKAIISLIDLCQKLHGNILEADSKTLVAFKELSRDTSEFHSSSSVIMNWRS